MPIDHSDHTHGEDDLLTNIITEFSEVFAFSRTRWARFAEEVHPALSGSSLVVLQVISRKGPMTATGLTQLLDMDKSLVSRQIAKLRDLGFVDTVESPEDRRVQLITVSPTAAKLFEHVRSLWANSYRERFEGWSTSDLQSLLDGLSHFNAAATDGRHDGPAIRCARQAADSAANDTTARNTNSPE